MMTRMATIGLAAISMAATPVNALAQTAPAQKSSAALEEEVARLRAEVEEMRAEMRAMRAQQAAAAPPAAAQPSAPAASTEAPPALAQAEAPKPAKADPDAVVMTWKGAPEFKTASGWSFKPRGRMQIDAGYLSAPPSRPESQDDGRGFTSRLRRAYIGVQGTIPGGFGYRAEVDLANNAVEWTDIYVTYDKGPWNVTIGQHNNFQSMEQLESDLFLTFNERAAFTGAFNFERRVGISAGYRKGAIMANAGVFTDDVTALSNDGDKGVSIDGRVVWMPKFGDLQLHFGGSAHHRNLNTVQGRLGIQYRQRPYLRTTDIRYVDTGLLLPVQHEDNYGLEFAANRKRIHLAGEAAWMKVDRLVGTDPLFFGGYAEAGIFLTKDTRGYKNGVFDRTVPTSPLGDGGFGALELNVRYDHLDLTDADVVGGEQDGIGGSIVWTPVSYVRFIADYIHLSYDIPINAQPKFNAETWALRAQFDF